MKKLLTWGAAGLITMALLDLSVHASCSDPPFMHADWSYCDKQKENLSNANMMVANLSYANLTNADLSNANLTTTNLSKGNLAGANLTNANLTNADLKDANLKNANLTGTKGVPSPAEDTTTETEEITP